MKVGDIYYMPTWEEEWELKTIKHFLDGTPYYDFLVLKGENKGERMLYCLKGAKFEGELI